MTEREEDGVFGAYKAAVELNDLEAANILEAKLLGLLTNHGYAVCWEVLQQRRLDVVNEALVRIMKSIRSFRGDSKFSTYAHRIFINECRRVAVKERLQYKREVPLEDAPEPTAPDAQGEYVCDEAVLAMLPERDRAFFVAKEHGFSDMELGTAFGLSLTGVRVRWHRIRKKLQGLLHST